MVDDFIDDLFLSYIKKNNKKFERIEKKRGKEHKHFVLFPREIWNNDKKKYEVVWLKSVTRSIDKDHKFGIYYFSYKTIK